MGTIGKGYLSSKKFLVIRDTREQKGCGWMFRASKNCHGQEVKKLDVGDYTVHGLEKTLMIERKTIGDLWGTLGNQKSYERFLREMDRAKNHKLKFLIIEGTLACINVGYKYSKVPVNNIHAKLVSLQVKHNLHVIFAGSKDTARAYARRLMDKIHRYHKDGLL